MEPTEQISSSRLGIHYFPDTLHYRIFDLEVWVPEIRKMGMNWLTLIAPLERAIPDYFIEGLRNAQIQPIPHFYLPTNQRISAKDMQLLFRSYARWGIHEVVLFDRPNLRNNWAPHLWTQGELAENFLDLFIPLAEAAVGEGLKVIFPPLEPGGDYWDLSFLESAMEGLARRCRPEVVQHMAFGVQSLFGGRPLDWGKGGPDRWPGARPYLTPPDSEDHLGFRIFEWYSAIARRVFGYKKPIYLLRASPSQPSQATTLARSLDAADQTRRCLSVAELMDSPAQQSQESELASEEVVACIFWLLSAQADSPWAELAWFRPGADPHPVVKGFYRWAARAQRVMPEEPAADPRKPEQLPTEEEIPAVQPAGLIEKETGQETREIQPKPKWINRFFSSKHVSREELQPQDEGAHLNGAVILDQQVDPGIKNAAPAVDPLLKNNQGNKNTTPISHYVLLPLYAWGAADWDLSIIEPMLQQSHPTIGFSLDEARLAQRVTVIGGEGALSKEACSMLQANGCQVERVLDDGTLVAS